MHDFVSLVLRKYYAQTSWNPYNSYLHLTSSSHAVLDFAIPTGLSLSISASPSPPFFTTYRLRALPTLSGALGYIYASVEDDDGNAKGLDIGSSENARFKDVIDRFRIIEAPARPIGKEQVFQGGRRVDRQDYLLYGCMHVPSSRVDALFTSRLSPTWQLLMTAISMPPRSSTRSASHVLPEKTSEAGLTASTIQSATAGILPPGTTNLQINLQQDTGKWYTEYSYSVDDGLHGLRVLHNLGQLPQQSESVPVDGSPTPDVRGKGEKRTDEDNSLENTVGGGLQGRFSVGAELFFSPLEKSAGLSTGVRFTTLPDNVAPPTLSTSAGSPTSGLMTDSSHHLSQPPTTITATLNPMMGHLSTAYAARMTRDIVACSRFDFNVYSYDSDLTLGAEYWIYSKPPVLSTETSLPDKDISSPRAALVSAPSTAIIDRQLEARVDSGLSLRDSHSNTSLLPQKQSAWSLRDSEINTEDESGEVVPAGVIDPRDEGTNPAQPFSSPLSHTLGVIKARLSTSGNVALLWEGRMRNCLVSFGIKADLSSAQDSGSGNGRKPLRGVGLDVTYFTQNRQD